MAPGLDVSVCPLTWVATSDPDSYTSRVHVGSVEWFVFRTHALNCCSPAPTVGFPVGVAKLTRHTVAVLLVVVSQVPSGESGSSVTADREPVSPV
jgi:hypothetical protein